MSRPLVAKADKDTKGRKTRYHIGNYVYVANEESVKRQRAADNSPPAQRLTDHWVARILEIRALDRENVFARIFWMYWPDELPAGTTDGRKSVKGRQPYHGEHELVASNHSQFCLAGCANCSAVANLS
jgi:hypothetical protein